LGFHRKWGQRNALVAFQSLSTWGTRGGSKVKKVGKRAILIWRGGEKEEKVCTVGSGKAVISDWLENKRGVQTGLDGTPPLRGGCQMPK